MRDKSSSFSLLVSVDVKHFTRPGDDINQLQAVRINLLAPELFYLILAHPVYKSE